MATARDLAARAVPRHHLHRGRRHRRRVHHTRRGATAGHLGFHPQLQRRTPRAVLEPAARDAARVRVPDHTPPAAVARLGHRHPRRHGHGRDGGSARRSRPTGHCAHDIDAHGARHPVPLLVGRLARDTDRRTPAHGHGVHVSRSHSFERAAMVAAHHRSGGRDRTVRDGPPRGRTAADPRIRDRLRPPAPNATRGCGATEPQRTSTPPTRRPRRGRCGGTRRPPARLFRPCRAATGLGQDVTVVRTIRRRPELRGPLHRPQPRRAPHPRGSRHLESSAPLSSRHCSSPPRSW